LGRFKTQCDYAFETWKKNNPTKVLTTIPFTPLLKYTITELAADKILILEQKVNYFMNGFNNMINFEFKWDAQKDYEFISLNIQTS
jgi:alpha-amylase